jgi:hypothetical protein
MTDRGHPGAGSVALQGLVELLVLDAAPQPDGGRAPGSGTASARDALKAVAQLARAIETPAQAGDLDPEQAHRMAALLLVIRDALDPLGPHTPDPVLRFLDEIVAKLRR